MKIRLSIFLLMTFLLPGCYNHDIGISNDIKGQWIWKSSCGGAVGCVSSSQTNYRTLKISDTNVEIIDNGKITFNSNYSIINTTSSDHSKLYKIEFNGGLIWTLTISNNILSTDYASVLYSVYERQK